MACQESANTFPLQLLSYNNDHHLLQLMQEQQLAHNSLASTLNSVSKDTAMLYVETGIAEHLRKAFYRYVGAVKPGTPGHSSPVKLDTVKGNY